MKKFVNSPFNKFNKTMLRAGVVIVILVVVFAFLLPFVYPYGQIDIFYTEKVVMTDCGEACESKDFIFYPANENVLISQDFCLEAEKFLSESYKDDFTVICDSKEYICNKIIDDVYAVNDSFGVIGVISDYVIDFYDTSKDASHASIFDYADLFIHADCDLIVYDKNGTAVGELSKYIIRTSLGNDSFSYEQKVELRDILFGEGEKKGKVYSETLECELYVSVNDDSVSFKKNESKVLIDTYAKPSLEHPLGTDANGMDVLARLMYGGRISLIVGIIAATAGVFIGGLLGCISGLRSGVTDAVLMRFVDIFDSLPSLPVLLIVGDLVADLFLPAKTSVVVMILIITVFGWSQTAKIIRMKFIEINSCESSLAIDVSGVKTTRKVLILMLPQILPQILSLLFMGIGSVILTESSVSFFGLGVRFPYSTWGIMLSDSTSVNELGAHPSIWVSTVFMICVTVIGFYFIGESLSFNEDVEDYYSVCKTPVCEEINYSTDCVNILEIKNLTVAFSVDDSINTVVKDFSMSLKRGGIVALVGASGCGKSVTADVISGLLSKKGVVKDGTISFNSASNGKVKIGYIMQEPMSCFDPIMMVGKQLEESFIVSNPAVSKSECYEKVVEMLKRVGFSEPGNIYHMYPGQLSGGMCQRIMVASVLLQSPELIIADEPCSSLDTHSKLLILDLLKDAVCDGASLLIITHNIYEARYVTDDIISFDGKNRNDYAQHAIEPIKKNSQSVESTHENRLVADGIFKTYKNPGHTVNALLNVSLTLKSGVILGITGDEGSGKTTLANVLAGIVCPDHGSVMYAGKDISKISAVKRKFLKGKIQIIFQHPYNSLSKDVSVGRQIREVVRAARIVPRREEYGFVVKLMKECGLEEEFYTRNPSTLSGGQCKRVCIVRALASNPDVLICDEPLAYLDTDLHTQILQLLKSLTQKYSVSLVFISHDLDSMKAVCDEIMVMENGTVAENGSTKNVLNNPQSECMKRLIKENDLLKNKILQSEKE